MEKAMKKDHYPSAVLSLACALIGIACFLLIMLTTAWFDQLLYAYLLFFGASLLLGSYSLLIRRSGKAWAGVGLSLFFLALFLLILYMFQGVHI